MSRREFSDMPIQVDVKVHTPGLVLALHDLIQQYKCRHVLWGSFNHEVGGVAGVEIIGFRCAVENSNTR